MTLVARIVREKRGFLLPLAVALLANVGVYALVVYPLGVKSATAVERAAAASQARQSAERDLAAAEALVSGKAKAEEELATFYQKVLPAGADEARRVTYARLPDLARKAGMRFSQRHMELDRQLEKDSQLGRVQTRMELEGSYENIRQFLYELETAPEFLIVDDVSLGQSEADKPVKLSLEVSTYYRQGRNGA
jgi:Tfp pilus assembly protein PilO